MRHFKKTLFLGVLLINSMTVSPGLAYTCLSSIPRQTPTDEFTLHDDGTLTDHRTGLMWKRCLAGQSGEFCQEGTPDAMRWSDALLHAANSEFADYTDWRLPNIKELSTIVEYACFEPAMNFELFPSYFGDQVNIVVWSSSMSALNTANAWAVNFRNGGDFWTYKYEENYVRLVRGGQ